MKKEEQFVDFYSGTELLIQNLKSQLDETSIFGFLSPKRVINSELHVTAEKSKNRHMK